MNNVCVVGLGYIGLPTAAVMAAHGMTVVGVDIDEAVVAAVNAGKPHIVEPGLERLLRDVVASGGLTAQRVPAPAGCFVIAVPTPLDEAQRPMMALVDAAARSVAPVLKRGDVVILESTSPVGTSERLAALFNELRPDLSCPGDIAMAYCPERVLPGKILQEILENDRCVGGLTPDCAARAARVYENFVTGAVVRTTASAAELVKLAENSFRDVNIAFANELSMVAERLGVDVWEVIALANRHPRVQILRPGPGVGGHCIAVDPWFIVDSAPDLARLIRTSREVNDAKAHWVIDRVSALAQARPEAPINCFGLAFKADIDDLRESPALEITAALALRFPGRVAAIEPHISASPLGVDAPLLDMEEALNRGGIHVLLVDHTAFARVSPSRLVAADVVDTRGTWGRSGMAAARPEPAAA